jgi:hypothetical protein
MRKVYGPGEEHQAMQLFGSSLNLHVKSLKAVEL